MRPDAIVHRRLEVVMFAYEAAIIAVILAAGVSIALVQGGTLAGAAPLIVIGLAESLRIPLAGWSTRLALPGKAVAFFALAAISIASFDGLALVFSLYLDNRIANVLHAEAAVESAQHEIDLIADSRARQTASVASLVADVTALDAEAAALAKSMPPPPATSSRTCTWKGQRVSCSADAAAVAAYREAVKAYDSRLAGLAERRSGLEAKVDAARSKAAATSSPRAAERLTEARRALDQELMASPWHRLAASVFGARVSDVTEQQFNTLKRFVVLGLAATLSLLSAAVSVVAHLAPKGEKPGKLSRAIRGFAARWRRRLVVRRDVPGPVREQVRVVHIPVDRVTGLILDPDASKP